MLKQGRKTKRVPAWVYLGNVTERATKQTENPMLLFAFSSKRGRRCCASACGPQHAGRLAGRSPERPCCENSAQRERRPKERDCAELGVQRMMSDSSELINDHQMVSRAVATSASLGFAMSLRLRLASRPVGMRDKAA